MIKPVAIKFGPTKMLQKVVSVGWQAKVNGCKQGMLHRELGAADGCRCSAVFLKGFLYKLFQKSV